MAIKHPVTVKVKRALTHPRSSPGRVILGAIPSSNRCDPVASAVPDVTPPRLNVRLNVSTIDLRNSNPKVEIIEFEVPEELSE